MSSYDPRIVAQALEDLESELTRWSSVASDMLSVATDTQRHAKESVDRALHNAAIVLDRAQDDKDNIAKAKETVASNLEKCLNAANIAKETLQACQTALSQSNATLKKWEMELEKALAWLARAEARLEKAIQELERAQSALRSAEWNLSSAESRLRNCQNDDNRRDCSGEAAAVSRARSEVASARQWVRAAEQEVIAAKEEVERAKARVACCKRAVSFATEAVNLAQESVSAANQSINSAERSVEFARAAERLVLVAEKNMLAEIEAAENMMSETKIGQELTDNAAIHLQNADSAEDTAQIYSTSVRKELEYRIQQLRDLNRPAILESGDWSLPKNVSPSEIKVSARPDGKTSVVYGNQRNESGKIVGQHGHTVISQDGRIDYARTQGQTVKQDNQPLVSIEDIEEVPFSDLIQSRLDMLQNGYNSFEDVLASESDPIALDMSSGKPYRIIDGRHRIYLARKKGLKSIPVKFV